MWNYPLHYYSRKSVTQTEVVLKFIKFISAQSTVLLASQS
jgi:hypothetical protein